MQRRPGANINSVHFMKKPVLPREDESASLPSSRTQPFLVKGDDSSTDTDTSGITMSSDDSIIIDGDAESFKLNRTALKQNLIDLKPFAHLPGSRLPQQQSANFKVILEVMRTLYGTPAMYDVVLADVHSIYGDLQDVKPGTVGAFFSGCFQNDNFSGPLGCSPKCAASLPPTEGTPGYANCDDLVLIYDDGAFSSLNDKRSEHAFVYIGDTKFSGFTVNDIRQLRDAGIINVSLIFGDEDGAYKEITAPTVLSQLPTKAGESEIAKTEATQTSSSSSNTGAGIAIAIIVIIIIILLAFLLFKNSGNYY
jgi:hypothetical protein